MIMIYYIYKETMWNYLAISRSLNLSKNTK